jgi:DNA-binding response OmpR family regulator
MNPISCRVILVEDDANSAESLRRFLSFTGSTVYIAPDLAAARALAKSIQFDVLITDLQLPDGSGWDLLQELSSEKRVPAIAVSGCNSLADKARSARMGFVDHIGKPIAPEKLATALRNAMELKSHCPDQKLTRAA